MTTLLSGLMCHADLLEDYVDASAVVMIFVSKGYFNSGNCLREAERTVSTDTPIALVHDPVKGGERLDVIIRDECADHLREPIFGAGREVIEWHRVRDFQLVSLKLLAAQLLLGCPSRSITRTRTQPGGGRGVGGGAGAGWSRSLFIAGEVSRQRMGFRSSNQARVYVSPHNAGALASVEALRAGMRGGIEIVCESAITDADGRRRLREHSTHFVLYLNHGTFAGRAEDSQRLAEEVADALVTGTPTLVLLHETVPSEGGCAFDRFFETTPQDLICAGLYKPLALPLCSGAFWPVSVALVARALGATDAALCGDSRSFTTGGAVRAGSGEAQPVAPGSGEAQRVAPGSGEAQRVAPGSGEAQRVAATTDASEEPSRLRPVLAAVHGSLSAGRLVASKELSAKGFALGARVDHAVHGPGRVVEHMNDGRTRVLFDSGQSHRYKPQSLHKLSRQGSSAEGSRRFSACYGWDAGSTCSREGPGRMTERGRPGGGMRGLQEAMTRRGEGSMACRTSRFVGRLRAGVSRKGAAAESEAVSAAQLPGPVGGSGSALSCGSGDDEMLAA